MFAELVIILIAESLHSSQTVKILAVWFTVVSVNWYLLIWGIYFNSKCRSQFETYQMLTRGKESKSVYSTIFFFVFALFVSPYVEYHKFSQCSRENNA